MSSTDGSTPEPGVDGQLAIVVPTRNRLGMLRECLGRVLAGPVAAQVVVVDDASDDDTADWLGTVDDPRVTVVRLPARVGGAEARNHGLERVDRPYVVFLDDDDLLVDGGVRELVRALAASPGAVAAVGRGVEFDEDGGREDRLGPARADLAAVFPEILAGWCPQVAQAVFRTEAVRGIGGWTSHLEFCNDYDLWLRVAARGPVALRPVLTVEVRVHAGQVSWSPDSKLCTARGLSRAAARAAHQPVTTTRVHAAAWSRYQAQQLDGRDNRGHRVAAAACYLLALALAPELRRSAVMGPELTLGLRRTVGALRGRPAA